MNGPRRGEELLLAGPRVRIGRSRDNDVVLPDTEDPQSSGHHAEALAEGGAWWIVDAQSRHGTFVNGVRVERRALAAGDVVAFGGDRFLVSGRRLPPIWWAIAAAVVIAIVVGVAATLRGPAKTPEAIAAMAARAVHAIVIEDGDRRSIVGTAFAVESGGVLATNAHVADAIRDRHAWAARSDTFERRGIAAVSLHPKWKRGELPFDAALLRLEPGPPLDPLPLAEGPAARLARGARLLSFGFPLASTDAERPRGRLSVDVVGDVRGDYIETGLAIAPGTSGSPVFDESGRVVAIVAGGDFVADASGRMSPTGSAVNWAISVSVLREILNTLR